MKVSIKGGDPIVMAADKAGPAYHRHPITVTAETDKGRVTQTTLSLNGSRVAEGPTGRLKHELSGREFKPGTYKLFATATDGTETVSTEQDFQVTAPPAKAPPPPAPTTNTVK